MNNSKGIVLLPLLIMIGAVVAFTMTAVVIYQANQQPALVSTTTNTGGNTNAAARTNINTSGTTNANGNTAVNTNSTTNANTDNATVDWQNHINSEGGYSLKYPNGWALTVSDSDAARISIAPPDAENKTSIELGPEIGAFLAATVPDSAPPGTNSVDIAGKYDCNQNRQEILVAGTKAIRQNETCFATLVRTYLAHNQQYLVFSWPEVFEDDYPEYEQILSTIELKKRYSAPTGNFRVTDTTNLLAVGYDGERANEYVLRVMDVQSGNIERSTTLTTPDKVLFGAYSSFGASNGLQFGEDGESAMFAAGDSPGMTPPEHYTTGLYRFNWSTPDVIETIVKYRDDAMITNWLYDAQRNRAIYLLADIVNSPSTGGSLNVVDLATHTTRVVKRYDRVPTLAFLGYDGTTVVNYLRENSINPSQGRHYLEYVTLSTGATTTVTLSEAGATPVPDPNQYSLSPNRRAFASWDDTLTFRTLPEVSRTEAGLKDAHNVNLVWSRDSGKVFVLPKDGGKIYDLAKGIIDTVQEANFVFLGAPGNYAVYNKPNNEIFAYSFGRKTSVKLDLPAKHTSIFQGMNWVTK